MRIVNSTAALRALTLGALVVAGVLLAASRAEADAVADFYTGKTINILVGSDAGGGYDAQARFMAQHLGEFIPGNPSLIVQNVPGAGGILAANRIYNVAAQDGTYMAFIQRGILTSQLTQQPGVHYEVAKFHWIGNFASETAVVVAWSTAPFKTAQDLFDKELIVAGTGVIAVVVGGLLTMLCFRVVDRGPQLTQHHSTEIGRAHV